MTEFADWMVKNGASLLNIVLSVGIIVLYREMKYWQGEYVKFSRETLKTEVAIAKELGIELPGRSE